MNVPAEVMGWVEALGWSLVHFVWQGLVIGAAFALVRALLPRENSAARYASGLIALGLLALSPLLTLWVLWPESVAATSALQVPLADGQSLVSGFGAIEPASQWSDLLPWLVLLWIAGVILMTGRAVHQWRALDRIATRLAYRHAEIEELLIAVGSRFGGMAGARVLVSAFIDTPTLIGWFKPVILLPAAVVIGFPRQQLELILAHELGHLRRYDHLVNLAQAIVETLLFYHPVVHWISREVRHEREVCCDNLVLRMTDSEPREYARTLAALEDVRQLTPQLAVAASGGMLLDRVRRIVGSKTQLQPNRRSHRAAWLVAAASITLVVGAILVSRPSAQDASTAFDPPSVPAPTSLSLVRSLEIEGDGANPVVFATLPTLTAPEPVASPQDTAQAGSGTGADVALASAEIKGETEVSMVTAPSLANPADATVSTIEVADLDLSSAKADIELGPAGPAVQFQPTLVHMVSPDYPGNGMGAANSKVGFEFAIDHAGNVRNVRVVSGDSKGAFAAAARRALLQWRFDPRSLQVSSGEKFRQDFEFVSGSQARVDEDSACTPRTGSHVCRPARGTGSSARIESDEETMSQMIVLAGGAN
ncbi:MAG TPA: M56 family metallopeptidase [Dokdonella sp.]|uniref:M56 family metallopeptidase n=2 Tax=Dokdonella sp. TaxID=2291710 RepID=UPI002C481AF3|nr:M56 family metallopeptidase [Dokdonella sp.]HOX70924.1 M56 family metallopeptidase [Dokdonella sp.]HPG95146.1 M56 family metallopeptidase [Dokdonella sp.]HPN80416.1 M56 family metallopeptidase [Dokdonella sp.]